MLKSKLDYLHAEGVATTAWALANAGIADQELWGGLKKLIMEKDFAYKVVANDRFSVHQYQELNGREHFFEGEVDGFTN